MFSASVSHLRKFATSASIRNIRKQRLQEKVAEEKRKLARPARPISKYMKEIFQYNEEANLTPKN